MLPAFVFSQVLAQITLAAPTASATPCTADVRLVRAGQPGVIEMRYGAPTPPAKAVVEAGVRPDGQLEYATIYASTSFMVLDRAALEIIRNSTFSPKVVDCKAVEAKQLYVVDFSNAPPTLSPTAFPSPSPSPYVQ